MKKWIVTLLLIVISLTAFKAEGQTITQTYIDPCDNKVYVVVIPFGQNQTVAVIRGKSKIVTLADMNNGNFQKWVNSVFAEPCPVNDNIRLAQEAAARAAADAAARAAADAAAKAAADAAAKAASEAAAKAAAEAAAKAASSSASAAASSSASAAASSSASAAASSSAANAATPPPINIPPPPPTPVVTAPPPTAAPPPATPPPTSTPPPASGGSSSPPPASGSGSSSSSSSTEAKPAEAKPAEAKPAETKSDKPAEQKTEEKKTEAKTEEKKEEAKTEEKKSEEKKEETKKEEEKKEETKKEEKKKEEKKEEKKKKQEATNPTLLASDISVMEATPGSFLASISLGLSKSSLAGDVSYSAGLMVNSNLSSIVMTGGITKMGMTEDGQLDAIHSYGTGIAYLGGNYMNLLGYTYIKPTAKNGTYGYNVGVINLFLKNDNTGGFEYNMASSAIVFWTKPYQYNKKLTISPQVFTMFAPISYNSATGVTTVNRHMGFLLGAAFDYKISKRFGFSANYKLSGNTKPFSDFLNNFQIGSRMVL
jgi:hypothetical protein